MESVTNNILMETITTDLVTTDASIYNNTDNISYNISFNVSNQDEELNRNYFCVFETFIIVEIIMTAIELVLSTTAAIKISRWRRNFRNQMIMQLSIARFIKRVIFFVQFMGEKYGIDSSTIFKTSLTACQVYIDFVIIILVCFFIKHMYDSIITVIVKISINNLYNVLCYSWLIPLPVTIANMVVVSTKLLEEWTSYFLICIIFRWPLIIIGTALYLTILYKVLTDKIRKFARSLTILTFFLCLVINFYLLSKDIIKLWCFQSFSTILISYVLGFILNFLILCLYVILIFLNFKTSKSKSCNSLPDFSTANTMHSPNIYINH